MSPRVGYVGLSHLGLCSAAAAASKGFATVAYDADSGLVERISRGALPVLEPGLEALVAANRSRLEFTADAARLAACDLVYIARDVATDDEGRSDLAPVVSLIEAAAAAMRPGATLVVLCQVPPGFTRAHAASNVTTVYQVETLVFGRAVERATLPERFIVGLPDPAAPLPQALAAFLGAFGCPILPMRLESAELAKMSINICLAASVTVANTLAGISERVGADWREIVPALKLDARIGPAAYLDPGLGLAGGNIERDVAALTGIGAREGADTALLRAIASNSAHARDWAWRALTEAGLAKDATIALLGLAYKPDTHSIKNSAGVALARKLRGRPLRAHDPAVAVDCLDDPAAVGCASPIDAARGAEALVIATPWAEYKRLDPAGLARAMAGKLIVDPYRTLDPAACARAGLRHFSIGRAEARIGDVR